MITNEGLKNIIAAHFDGVRDQIMDNYHKSGMKASGKFERETYVAATNSNTSVSVSLVGAPHSRFVDGGRNKTSQGALANEPRLQVLIAQWMKDKGITGNAYAITKKIHKFGWVPRSYSKIGKSVISSAVSDNGWKDNMVNELRKYVTITIKNIVIPPWHELSK